MGNNSIRGSESVDISLNHPKITHAKTITTLDRSLLRVSMPVDEGTYKKWKELIHKHKHLDHQHLLLPLNHKFVTKGLCASTGDVEIDFHNCCILLSEEIVNRQNKNLPFTEGQLWYLLYSLLSAKSYLKDSTKGYPNQLIGDIRPQNVFISPKGQVRFANLLSWPGQKVNYAKTFDGVVTYLSPEDVQSLQLGKMNNQSNQESSQNFAIGLTLISAALLIDNSDLYDINKQTFDEYEAQRRINAFKVNKSYSQILRAVIAGFCVFNPSKRLAWSEVWNWVRKYENKILEKQYFAIDELPFKINQYINTFRSEVSQIKPENTKISIKSKKILQEETKNITPLNSSSQNTFQARQVTKSSSGYYSPRNFGASNGQPVKVFIQYKSPGKDISVPHNELANVKKQVEKSKLQPKKQEAKQPIVKIQQKKVVQTSQLDQISFSIIQKNIEADENVPNLQGSVPQTVKAVQKLPAHQPSVKPQTFAMEFDIPQRVVKANHVKKIGQLAGGHKSVNYMEIVQKLQPVQKIVTKKQEPVTLDEIQKLKQVKKESDKAIVQILTENKQENQNVMIEQKIVTLQSSYEQVPEIYQSSQQITLVSVSQPGVQVSQTNAHIVKSNADQQLNNSARRSYTGPKKDFLDEVIEVNKVLNNQEHKDYYENNQYLASENAKEQN